MDEVDDVSKAPRSRYDRRARQSSTLDSSSSLSELSPGPSQRSRRSLGPTSTRNYVWEVVVPPVDRKRRYEEFSGELRVEKVLRETIGPGGEIFYQVRCGDGEMSIVSFRRLLRRPNGPDALNLFSQSAAEGTAHMSASSDESDAVSSARQGRHKALPDASVRSSEKGTASDEDELGRTRTQSNGTGRGRRLLSVTNNAARHLSSTGQLDQDKDSSPLSSLESDNESDHAIQYSVFSRRAKPSRSTRSRRLRSRNSHSPKRFLTRFEDEEDSSGNPVSYLSGNSRTRGGRGGSLKRKRGQASTRLSKGRPSAPEVVRRSSRTRNTGVNLAEKLEDDIWASDSDQETRGAGPAAVGVREKFKALPRSDAFRRIHIPYCDSCSQEGDRDARDPLVFCQGCTISYHRSCLGPRNQREHIVTKIGEDDCVLQCRRCVGATQKREDTAPAQYRCQVCEKPGLGCRPFREKKTTKQEEKEREDNGGQDPLVPVDEALINSSTNLLFRCESCRRGFHFAHLPPRSDEAMDLDDQSKLHERISEYCGDWRCIECLEAPAQVQSLVAWRPVDMLIYVPGATVDTVNEDDKEYLVKWHKLSYFRATWMPGPWVWGVTPPSTKKAFARKYNGQNMPRMTSEDAIPEEFLRVDIVLDVKFTSSVPQSGPEIDKVRVKEVRSALVKYKGLGYEDVVWESPPTPDDGERWKDFVTAYEDWVLGRYVSLPKQHALKERLNRMRTEDFESKVMKRKQPEALTGGKIMGYQMEGLNWLLYKFYREQNAILADEMGLGKTIQIIAYLAALVHDRHCWPFLIVVPNSTCQNWRREIKQWAPSLRVVAYYGSSEARRIAMKHELYPEGPKDLKCHIVVTSYEAPADVNSSKFFRSVPWAGMIVDEGQRLKNDKSQLYEALSLLNVPSKILLTGTPLQNNARELFNLLQFLDKGIKAAELEETYAELTKEKVSELHNLIRPFFLRRTKVQVLDFLPPLAQIIVPVSMSIVQKKLSKSILSKNTQLIKAIFGTHMQQLKQAERGNLNNLLMQLRKCLCHPFVYSQAIEEQNVNAAVSHRNLVDASPKLQLLEIMLPKLKERGHRVLIFSQFLDMLDIIEDFLDGLNLKFDRLDGSIGSLQKQKRIDAFNAPNSELFAFLLSTRAGGVGINLATADTVIIMDPDFNPHQDIQALSRAHRIGQKKKVLVFQMMTRDSAEEKMMQVGRKKMALDHVLIEQMDAEDDEGLDLESILRHGAARLFDDDDTNDIRYDPASVDHLLDRSQLENTQTGADNSAESQFSFARVWAKDRENFEDSLKDSDTDQRTPDPSIWEKLLEEREQLAAKQRSAMEQTLGRGKRNRKTIDYTHAVVAEDERRTSPPAGRSKESDSDTDFQEKLGEEEDPEEDVEDATTDPINPNELQEKQSPKVNGLARRSRSPPTSAQKGPHLFQRARIPILPTSRDPLKALYKSSPTGVATNSTPKPPTCLACDEHHRVGYCPLKLAGVEYCPLCGIAHFAGPQCPHMKSETQVRLMLEALKQSPEEKAIKDAAITYLRGRKGALVRKKKEDRIRAEQSAGVSGGAGGREVSSAVSAGTAA
ncbi:MAG: hypothetical protein M4579_006581 [Chaenotheca gracillima]|nr:MAG: hypothetical protein M4579_006581 [Chaenotheca gracillima]